MAVVIEDTAVYDDVVICQYEGTDDLHIKMYLIGVFAATIAVLSIIFNSFLALVFARNASLRSTPLFYFGILALLDIIMGFNYLALMAVPVYMDFYNALWLYHLFLSYLRPIYTESYAAMFSSMLMIFVATLERLLRTFKNQRMLRMRHLMETHRAIVSSICILVAIVYKLCIYFEVQYTQVANCTGFSQYIVELTELSVNPHYSFYWMFLTRNIVDRIVPFFSLVLMNFFIINTLKREQRRQSLNSSQLNIEAYVVRHNLRDATLALVSIVSMYLMSQTLQIIITFWEALYRQSLENDFRIFYSYINDIISIMTLLSSCLRLPVYCACNPPIASAAAETLRHLCCANGSKNRQNEYHLVASRLTGRITADRTLQQQNVL